MLLATLLFIVCLAIVLVKEVNPPVRAIARNILIMLGILLVVFVLIGVVGFWITQRSNSLQLKKNVDYILSAPEQK